WEQAFPDQRAFAKKTIAPGALLAERAQLKAGLANGSVKRFAQRSTSQPQTTTTTSAGATAQTTQTGRFLVAPSPTASGLHWPTRPIAEGSDSVSDPALPSVRARTRLGA